MNAMWGAGQMMFNKILVLADEHVKIQNYETLAKYVFKNLNPATDIYFSQGPMDVLDHSCSKLGFGGKMCIDGTTKFEEEKEEGYKLLPVGYELDAKFFKNRFREIYEVNTSLLKKEIPCLIISVEKNRKGHIRELHGQVCESPGMEAIKMILYVEHTVDANDLPTALWRFCNNLDPKRDHMLCEVKGTGLKVEGNIKEINLKPQTSNLKPSSCMGFDGTRKTKELDDFHRDWPNIIVADDATRNAVDKKWNDLGIGKFISSPSLKFKDQLYGEEAAVRSF
jgi:4-hydroxy-3-polyprenylbenzoate decarboxylase